MTRFLESYQPQLENTGCIAGLLLPGWLSSDIAVSHHLLALSGDKGGHAEVQGGGKGRQSMQGSDEGENVWLRKSFGAPRVGASRLCSGTLTLVGRGLDQGSQSNFSSPDGLVRGSFYILLWLNTRVFCLLISFFLPSFTTPWILVPQARTGPLEAQSPNHWTARKFPVSPSISDVL